MPQLLPFRQFDEHDVVNLFSYSGALPVNEGTFVKPLASGWRTDETDPENLGSAGASFNGLYSSRYGNKNKVGVAGTGDNVIGLLLYGVREYDENGEKLLYHRRKADEMKVVLSGETVPIATRGMFLWSGTINGALTAGATLYPSGNGDLTVNSVNQNKKVGTLWGLPNGKGHALIQLNVL